MQNYYRVEVSLEAASLFLRGRGKAVYILPSSDPILALLLVDFTEYDDDDDDELLKAIASCALVQFPGEAIEL
ncbi:hypothetical protein Hanom_Chr14g01261381 [Helianthus anomalus]